MTIIAGIDEAGLGPILGPLVVSGVAFRIPDASEESCLWKLLRDSCTRDVKRGVRKLPIADSKRLYRPGAGLSVLERSALVMLSVFGCEPRSWRELLDYVAPGTAELLDQYPWYSSQALSLPCDPGAGDVVTRANAVRRNCTTAGLEPIGVYCEPLPEGHYNRLVRNTRNKSVVLLGLALRVIDRIMKAADDERVIFLVDRLGGRKRYRDSLTTSLPAYDLQILEETDERSAYRLMRSSRTIQIEFATKSEDRHFVVALASMYSKYVRELFMRAFNRYWCDQQEGLRATAGYYSDALRWLTDAKPTMDRLSIRKELLVRIR